MTLTAIAPRFRTSIALTSYLLALLFIPPMVTSPAASAKDMPVMLVVSTMLIMTVIWLNLLSGTMDLITLKRVIAGDSSHQLHWVASEEDFFKELFPQVERFKLRVSFGILGSDNVDPFLYRKQYAWYSKNSTVFSTTHKR